MEHQSQNSSASYAWYVNANNADVNNNTRTNGYQVRPFSDFLDTMEDAPAVPSFADFLEAYYDCRKSKRTSINALLFEARSVRSVYRLWKDVVTGKYEIGKSTTFVISRPVKREVFAASFRDRIVHHWICLRLEPLFENYFFDCMKANRKGRGTLSAVKSVYDDLRSVTEGFTEDAWIYKFDLQGFFMSIDKSLLNKKLQAFIDERYEGADKPTLKWLVEKVVLNCPQSNCYRKCPEERWAGLPKNKSLFGQDNSHGLPIGNLTSQWFANFLLYDVVKFCKDNGFNGITEYVDDFVIIHPDRTAILNFIPRLRKFTKEKLGITLHPRKTYIQHYTKGLSFVGAIIKPYRIYLSHRAMRNSKAKIHWMVVNGISPEKIAYSVNSYLGLSKHFAAYNLRKWIMRQLFSRHIPCYFTNNILTMKLLKRI